MPYRLISVIGMVSLMLGCAKPAVDQTRSEQWFKQGKAAAEKIKQQTVLNTQAAKNIVLVVGDGMGITTLTAARIFNGQQQGNTGEENQLSFEAFPHVALIKTYNTDQQTPDSAGTMTALISGEKTDAGVLGVKASAERGNCASMAEAGTKLNTLADLAAKLGKKTAVVTTTRVTHATPAATYAHSVERNWESDDKLPESAQANGCKDIASQFVDNWAKHQLDVLLGGGRRHFLPESAGGKRKDGVDLTQRWQQQGGVYLTDADQLAAMPVSDKPVLGLFSASHIEYAYQRPDQQPGLQAMTAAALKQIQGNEEGYLLVIEAGRIDHGHHAGQAYKALTETEELHQTIGWLQEQIDLEETLIIVTADHSHTLTLLGYPTRGNPVLGRIRTNRGEVLDYPTLNYRNGPGAARWHKHSYDEYDSAADSGQVFQPALVPLEYETHGGEDVALYAAGPWAHLFGGTMEQHWVYHVMEHAFRPE